jgi:hypothetical protein
MSGAVARLHNTPSWRGAQLKKRTGTTLPYLIVAVVVIIIIIYYYLLLLLLLLLLLMLLLILLSIFTCLFTVQFR